MKKRTPWLLFAVCGMCLAGAIFSGYGILGQIMPQIEAEQIYEEIRGVGLAKLGLLQTVTDDGAEHQRRTLAWEALKEINPDISGWIYSPETDIDYPIVQGRDNSWYLNHGIDQKESVVGSIFLESRNQTDFSDDVSIIYGHHIRGGRMFSSITGYKRQEYYERHPVLYLYTPEGAYRVKLFAGTILDGTSYRFPLLFADEKEWEQWLKRTREDSTFQSDGTVQYGERILALCTCSYEYENARYAIYGIMEKLEIDTDEERRENAG